ncbi:MAG: ATP-dependent helicase HrpB [Desulfobacula sp.]|nr:ATP-dependent helicase HrpB [Desulfobacula sp.]
MILNPDSSMIKLLPIDTHLPRIKLILENSRCAVIQAPPGAGKTTRVPLALLDESWILKKKILLLEPRRLAAISCAAHMADLLNEKVGQTIGYRIRMDKRVGPTTRVLVVTEGVFIRMIQSDPELNGVGLVIFDEFQERNIHSDLGLALCLESCEALRDDLRLLVMSATMDTEGVSKLMGNAPVVASKGKSYPVKTNYIPGIDRLNRKLPIESACAMAVRRALLETKGDLLVFLPGIREIMRLKDLLMDWKESSLQIIPLYGNLLLTEQAQAFKPAQKGKRKIIIATAIAETSITIDGIGVVIDAGLMRTLKFSLTTGMSRLQTILVSKASADQRRGRAGRTASGTCYRLWSEYDQSLLKPFSTPQILSTDLTGMALELAAWGVKDPGTLNWLDLPETKNFEQAIDLLKNLGALDEKGQITQQGKKMVGSGLHPRLAHMTLKAAEKGLGFLGCRLAAFLMEKDIVRFDKGYYDPDIRLRLELIEAVLKKEKIHEKNLKLNRKIVFKILESEKKIAKGFGIKKEVIDFDLTVDRAGDLLAYAYPDRIAKKRNNQNHTYLTAVGKGIGFPNANSLTQTEYIVAVHLDGNPKDAKVFLGAPYSRRALERDFSRNFENYEAITWDKAVKEVKAKKQQKFGRLVINEQIMPTFGQDTACRILIDKIQQSGLDVLPWTKKMISLKERAVFLKNTNQFSHLPDLSDKNLLSTIGNWLAPFITGIFSFSGVKKMDLEPAFSSLIGWDTRQVIEKNAPTHIIVPSGSKKKLDYNSSTGIIASPVLEVRLQEMFGLLQTPEIATSSGGIPVTLHLLSPAGRPVQITTDLESFWENTYRQVKKDLMGRYPKHYWPDDPMSATPTSRVRQGKL